MSLPPQRVVVSSDQTQGWVQLCRKPQRQRDHGQSYGLSSNRGGCFMQPGPHSLEEPDWFNLFGTCHSTQLAG